MEYDPWLVLAPEEVEEGGEIAADLAAFLLALHRFPTDEALGMGLPGPYALEAGWRSMRDETLPVLRQELEDDPKASNRRQQQARQRAARERIERVEAALQRLPELESKKKPDEKSDKK